MIAFTYLEELDLVVELAPAPELTGPRPLVWHTMPNGERFILAREGVEATFVGLYWSILNARTLNPEARC